jgi:small-conductance mechanosensitive channel
MAELEIHHEVEGSDPKGKRVGVQAAVIAVVLAVVTILSHRAHTDAVLIKAAANDTWQRYQSTRVKLHSVEVGEDLIASLAAKDRAEAKLAEYAKAKIKYELQSEELQKEAKHKEEEGESIEKVALHYDFGEGLLEIGLVLSSLYFIARRSLFPTVGIVAAVAGTILAAIGLVVG